MITVLLVLGLASALLGLYPFAPYRWTLALLPARPPAVTPAAAAAVRRRARVAVIVCAYNEAATIGRKLANTLGATARLPQARVLLYSDGSTDGTVGLAEQFLPAEQIVAFAGRRGKSTGINHLATTAAADFLVFTDANTEIAPDSLANLIGHFADPTVGCVCGALAYVNPAESPTAAVGAGYWSAEERLKAAETRTGSVVGADGSLFAIRAELFERVPHGCMDDFYTSVQILCRGYRVIRAHDAPVVERTSTDWREEFARKRRIACRALSTHMSLRPRLADLGRLDRFKYLAHRYLRWLSGYLLAGAAALLPLWAVLALPAAALALLAASAALAAALAALVRPDLPSRAWAVLTALAGTSLGVFDAWQGRRYDLWTPPGTTRQPVR